MKQKLFIPFILVISLILSSCEISRPGDQGNIAPVEEPPAGEVGGPSVQEPGPPPEGERPPDISTEQFEAPLAPEITAVEPGKVLVKLSLEASIQARSVELGADQVLRAGVPGLDEILRDIGASGLDPVIEEVAKATRENLETLSAQAEEVNQLYAVSFSPEYDPQEVANQLSQDPSVEYAEPNYLAGITASPIDRPVALTPNDPYYIYQWNFEAINLPAAWDLSTGAGVTVAIIDTGIDFNTPDLANTQRVPGYDFANDDDDPTDDQGHGTHVAGTVAQSTNNDLGVAGVAHNARLMAVKVLGNNGQGSYENIIQGIVFAVDQNADVINMSLAGRASSQALQEAVGYAHNRGVVVVAAAGNSNGPVEFPAAYDDFVIAVGAIRYDNGRAPYSNFGAQVDIVAPGGDTGVDQNGDGYADGILQQTFKTAGSPHTYLFFEGTSMASPHVAGVAALLLSRQSNLSPDEVKNVMMQTARNLGPSDQFGAGLVQADAAAVAVGETIVEQPDTPTPTPTTAGPTDTPTPTTAGPTDTPTPTTAGPTGTPTPTPATPMDTPTPTPLPPPGAGELLTNGGFENDEGWVFGDTPIRGGYDTGVVLSGSRSARLGATSGPDRFSFSSVWQRVTIPAEARQVTLTANVYPISQDRFGSDTQYISILKRNFRVMRNLSMDLSNSQTWERRSFDLSDLRGRTIYIYFSVFNRGAHGLSAMYVDDVSLTWQP